MIVAGDLGIEEIIKRETEKESSETKSLRLSTSQTLVSSIGCDFTFSDRNESFEILASSLEQRYYWFKLGRRDKMLNKLPFLADGPGSGKSRFLQELPKSFVSYIMNLKQSIYNEPNSTPDDIWSYLEKTPAAFDDFKSVISSAVFINITFGYGFAYSSREIEDGIEVSLSLRILYPYFAHRFSTFTSFYDAYRNKTILLPNLSLGSTLSFIGKDHNCIVLGIDEVNMLHQRSKEMFKDLFLIVGSISCNYPPFFVSVLAGTVIGPMKEVITGSMYPPCTFLYPFSLLNLV